MRISVVIPVYKKMPNWKFFLKRCLDSVLAQTFEDYEIIMPENGKGWASNHNEGISSAKGDLIKFLHQDDWLEPTALQEISDKFKGGWLITACSNNPNPYWTENIWEGNNKLGGPSCLTIENDDPIKFDEGLRWLVDCQYYMELDNRYGEPTILPKSLVNIGLHSGQATHLIPTEEKIGELTFMHKKYDSFNRW